MKKFDKVYSDFLVLYEMNNQPLDIREGDVVTFTKDCLSHPYIQSMGSNSTTIQRIKEMMETKNNLVVNQLRTSPPSTYGSMGSFKDNGQGIEGLTFATVSEQYSDGLHKNLVTVPVSMLNRIDLNNSLRPVSDEQVKEHPVGDSPAPDANNPNNEHPGYRNRKDLGINKLG